MISQEIARGSIGKTKKILQTLSDNSNQTILYKLLQMYVKMGLKLKKVHCVVKFEQEAWLEQDITLNTTKSQQARNKFEKDLYKTFKKLCLWEKMRFKSQSDALSHSQTLSGRLAKNKYIRVQFLQNFWGKLGSVSFESKK